MGESRQLSDARVVVGLDFGTTFSGFAYAHINEPDAIHTVYEWPMQSQGGGKPYCKTQTSLLYAKSRGKKSRWSQNPTAAYEVRDWGWPAQITHLAKSHRLSEGSAPAAGHGHEFVERFKLLLAPPAAHSDSRGSRKGRRWLRWLPKLEKKPGAVKLPPGVSVQRAVSDYLGKLAQFAVEHLQSKYGSHITMREVQWCLTVPAIWDELAKQQMIQCAETAGMVAGPLCPPDMAGSASPHPVQIVLESEAASIYCARRGAPNSLARFQSGDEFVVADAGGGTVDIVVHKQVDEDGLRFQEVTEGSGGMCGCTFVDANFLDFLQRKVPCFRQHVRQHPTARAVVLSRWEDIKRSFHGSETWCSAVLELPRKLSAAWEEHCTEAGVGSSGGYDEVEITAAEMRGIFDPVVEQVIELVQAQVTARPGLKALMVVGGFSASPYLMRRIREHFSSQMEEIVNPPEPGSAICQGAVAMGIHPHTVVSRISRRTYGQAINQPFRAREHPWSSLNLELYLSGMGAWRSNSFDAFVRRGDAVAVDQCVTKCYQPLIDTLPMNLAVYSSSEVNPSSVTDRGCRLEGSLLVDPSQKLLPDSGSVKHVNTSMHFGRTHLQVTAQRVNFGDTQEVLMFKHAMPFQY